jgi:hypothetical protein
MDLFISFDTSMSDIETLRSEMHSYITAPENSRDFQPELVLRCVGVGSMDQLQLQLEARHKSSWSNEQVRAARHSKLMCALVLALRKVPIFGPGGGGAPLGDPANPAYNASMSDAVADAARDKASKEADAARLHQVNPPPVATSPANSEQGKNPTNEPLLSIPEIMAADAMNAVRLSEDPLRDDEKEMDGVDTVGNQSSLAGVPSTSAHLEFKKSKTPQGRRRAGSSAPPRTSETEMAEQSEIRGVPSRDVIGDFDQEAQVWRSP